MSAREDSRLNIDGKDYPVLSERDPAKLPWRQMGIDVVFECTGVFRERDDLVKHIEAGARFVILSAPAKSEDVPTVVHAVNRSQGNPAQIISCASCTTNCITPVVEVMGRRIGIKKATMTTIHAYTSNQSIVDSGKKDYRRGRAGCRQPRSCFYRSGHCDHPCATRIQRANSTAWRSGRPCRWDPWRTSCS